MLAHNRSREDSTVTALYNDRAMSLVGKIREFRGQRLSSDLECIDL